jgi:hypothetical protein
MGKQSAVSFCGRHFNFITVKKSALWLLLAVVYLVILSACQPKPALVVGKSAPDFNLPDGLGNTLGLSDLRGSVVLLNFLGHLVRAVQGRAAHFPRAIQPIRQIRL